MGLLGEVLAAQDGRRRGGYCSVALVVEQLSKEDRAELEQAFGNRHAITAPAIAEVLQARGFDIKAQAIQRHRNGGGNGCSCPKPWLK